MFFSVCLIVGTVIGAGFITGAELLRFFAHGFYPSALFAAFVLFAAVFALALLAGGACGGFYGVTVRACGRFSKAMYACVYVGEAVIFTAMLSGIDGLFVDAFSFPNVPIISVLCAVCAAGICSRGIDGLKKFNAVLLPFMVVTIFVLLLINGKSDFTPRAEDSFSAALFAPLYVFMNVFLSAPVFFDAGCDKKSTALISAVIAAAIICGSAAFIIGGLFGAGDIPDGVKIPMLYVFKDKPVLYYVYAAVIFSGIFTTLVSAFYPLSVLSEKYNDKGCIRALIIIFALLFSTFGLRKIVDYAYPLFGALGAVYISAVFLKLPPERLLLDERDKRVHSSGK